MMRILLVGAGGFIGSVFRYVISGYVQELLKSFEFPYGTLAVNVLGCLILGFFSQLADSYGVFSSEARIFLFIGLLGGFTTFSTFGSETLNLLRDSERSFAMMNVAGHLILGIMAVWGGRVIAHVIWR